MSDTLSYGIVEFSLICGGCALVISTVLLLSIAIQRIRKRGSGHLAPPDIESGGRGSQATARARRLSRKQATIFLGIGVLGPLIEGASMYMHNFGLGTIGLGFFVLFFILVVCVNR